MTAVDESAARIGRYVVLRELGRGAMGVVVLARDPRVDRLVAIKTLDTGQGMDAAQVAETKQRFLNEARAAGRLRHPGVVGVLDADEDPITGRAFLVMEYVEGRELDTLIAEGLKPAQIADIIDGVAAALQHAHEKGVVHRDVKPANVLVDSLGHARLMDFGVARLGDSTMTRTGQLLGSPGYMSPEQVRGKPVTAASDIFSLGVVAYEALAGVRPFRGRDLISTTHAILHEKPDSVHRVPPARREAVDAVLQKALAKKAEERYASAVDFANALRHALDLLAETLAADVTPRVAAPVPVLPTPVRRRTVLVAAACLAVVGLAAAGWQFFGAPRVLGVKADPPPVAPAPRATLVVDLRSVRSGTVIVRVGADEVLRSPVPGTTKKTFSLSDPKRHVVVKAPIAAGRQEADVLFAVTDGLTLTKHVQFEVDANGTVKISVDVATFGKSMEARVGG